MGALMLKWFLALSLIIGVSSADAVNPGSKIHWTTNYEQAVQQAKSSGKPILLFFTGSDWCGWCHKLENEALHTPEFADLVGDRFIYVFVDFPLKNPLDPETTRQNKELQKRFDIRGYPTIIILDPEQRQLGSTGYRPGGAKPYADHLQKMVEDSNAYKRQTSQLDKSSLSAKEIEVLYGKACKLCRYEDAEKMLALGLKSEDNRFFLLESYRRLAEKGQMHDKEALALKEQLFAKDPDNSKFTQYELALIDFEAHSGKKNFKKPEQVAAPLLAYIKQFGDSDHTNTWRLNILIAQVYLDHKEFEEALKFAKQAYAKAPATVQPEIGTAIRNIQLKL